MLFLFALAASKAYERRKGTSDISNDDFYDARP